MAERSRWICFSLTPGGGRRLAVSDLVGRTFLGHWATLCNSQKIFQHNLVPDRISCAAETHKVKDFYFWSPEIIEPILLLYQAGHTCLRQSNKSNTEKSIFSRFELPFGYKVVLGIHYVPIYAPSPEIPRFLSYRPLKLAFFSTKKKKLMSKMQFWVNFLFRKFISFIA